MLILTLLSILSSPVQADDAIFDSPAGKPIVSTWMNPNPSKGDSCSYSSDDPHCYGDDEGRQTIYTRVTINAGAGAAWGSTGQTEGSVTANVNTFSDGQFQINGLFLPLMRTIATGSARMAMQNIAGVPLFQMKVEAALSARPVFPVGGFFVAVEADSFSRFSRKLARLGYTQATSFRLGNTGYVLLRYVYGLTGRGAIDTATNTPDHIKEAINNFQPTDSNTGFFPFGFNAGTGNLREIDSHSGTLLLQLAKFALRVDVTYATEATRRTEDDVAVDEFAPRQLKRFDTLISAVMPLAVLFPNDSLQIEGRYVSLKFDGDEARPEESRQTADGSFGIYYGLSW